MKTMYIILALLFIQQVKAQNSYFTKEGKVSFYSHAALEDIKAHNDQTLSIINTETGDISIKLLMRSFVFKKALMQEHFNENFVESEKYPKASFKGKIANFKAVTENSKVRITGILTLHGREKEVSTEASIEKGDNTILLKGSFNVEVSDFDINIPKLVKDKIAKTIKVFFELNHKPYKK